MSRVGIRADFVDRAVRAAERKLQIPSGWWGVWRDVTDGVVRVFWRHRDFSWVIQCGGHDLGKYMNRTRAINTAQKLRRR